MSNPRWSCSSFPPPPPPLSILPPLPVLTFSLSSFQRPAHRPSSAFDLLALLCGGQSQDDTYYSKLAGGGIAHGNPRTSGNASADDTGNCAAFIQQPSLLWRFDRYIRSLRHITHAMANVLRVSLQDKSSLVIKRLPRKHDGCQPGFCARCLRCPAGIH